jgi:hypothetical protein
MSGKCRGPQNGKAKLTTEIVKEIISEMEKAKKISKRSPVARLLAEKYNINERHVRAIGAGEYWNAYLFYAEH